MRWAWWGAVLGFCVAVLAMVPVIAEDAAVTVGVGDSILRVEGYASPGAFVTISRDGGIIGAVTAGSDGSYSQTFPAQTPGLHQISVVARTVGGADTDAVTTTVDIAEHGTTPVSIFLPSTLAIVNSSPAYGEPLSLRGETRPLSTVNVYIDNSEYITTTSNAAGEWQLDIPLTALASGQHSLFVRVTGSGGTQSYPTRLHYFMVAASPEPPAAPVSPPFGPPLGLFPRQAPGVPVITSPTEGTVWREPELVIRGTAGTHVQVEVWNGDTNLGSVWSDAQGNWTFSPTIAPGDYQLRARACYLQLCSGFSKIVRFTYAPNVPIMPLLIVVPHASFTVEQSQPLTITAAIAGGKAPFIITIHWGDGTDDTATINQEMVSFTHRYDKRGKYTATIQATDSQNRNGKVLLTVNVTPSSLLPLIGLLAALAAGVVIVAHAYRARRGRRKKRVR